MSVNGVVTAVVAWWWFAETQVSHSLFGCIVARNLRFWDVLKMSIPDVKQNKVHMECETIDCCRQYSNVILILFTIGTKNAAYLISNASRTAALRSMFSSLAMFKRSATLSKLRWKLQSPSTLNADDKNCAPVWRPKNAFSNARLKKKLVSRYAQPVKCSTVKYIFDARAKFQRIT